MESNTVCPLPAVALHPDAIAGESPSDRRSLAARRNVAPTSGRCTNRGMRRVDRRGSVLLPPLRFDAFAQRRKAARLHRAEAREPTGADRVQRFYIHCVVLRFADALDV